MASRGFNIFDIYRRYCELRSGKAYACGKEGEIQDDKSQKATITREALAELLRFVESSINSSVEYGRISIFDEIQKLMVELDLMTDFSKFSRFYDFVFFMCREKGQKNITVTRAVTAWRLVLVGRFRLLNQWCDFVERIQRHNISEDTWQQVLSFSRCVHENLEGYDPEGAWPILIDDFVEHMYRISGPKAKANSKFFCNCGDSESQSTIEDSLPGLKIFPGLKRKVPEDMQIDDEASDSPSRDSRDRMANYKRGRQVSGTDADGCTELIRHNNNGAAAACSPKSPCAVEGCLSKGFAGLFSSLQFDQERRVSFT